MENAHAVRPDPLSRFIATSCTCSFCLLVFSLDDPSENDLCMFQLHLRRVHGLKMGEPER